MAKKTGRAATRQESVSTERSTGAHCSGTLHLKLLPHGSRCMRRGVEKRAPCASDVCFRLRGVTNSHDLFLKHEHRAGGERFLVSCISPQCYKTDLTFTPRVLCNVPPCAETNVHVIPALRHIARSVLQHEAAKATSNSPQVD